jgi:DNA-binding NarL/FixJ family response regulator
MNILIVDDHLLFASSFASLLQSLELFDAIKISDKIDEMLPEIQSDKFDILFLDYLMPEINTMEVLHGLELKKSTTKVVIVSSVKQSLLISSLFAVGCVGFLSKNSTLEEVKTCIDLVIHNKRYISEALRAEVVEDMLLNNKPFTARELELLTYIAQGMSIEETAAKLYLSKYTVINHRRNMMEKAGVKNVTGLLRFAMDMGYL